VTFHRLDDRSTRVTLQMDYKPDSLIEKAGTGLGMVQKRLKDDPTHQEPTLKPPTQNPLRPRG